MRTLSQFDLNREDLLNKARRLRERAERANDPWAKKVWEEVAQGYEHLAGSVGKVESEIGFVPRRNLFSH
jgi:hypothetical protein